MSHQPMSHQSHSGRTTRRDLLAMIGASAGSVVMYQAMTALGHAAESGFSGEFKLDGSGKGKSVLVLGAGIAGLVAAHELLKAGYEVRVLEYNDRPGGRAWTLRGGDEYTELGGFRQTCEFDKGLYINPGPWRIPYHHRAYLSYARQFDVRMEPFQIYDANVYLHNTEAFGGKPQRFRHIMADFNGHASELLAKATNAGKLDLPVDKETREILLQALRSWGALDKNYEYVPATASLMRGFDVDPGVGPGKPSTPIAFDQLLKSGLWAQLSFPLTYEFGGTIFEPRGGMDILVKRMGERLARVISYRCKVTQINQKENGVEARYIDAGENDAVKTASADWCICTIPFSILSQIDNNLSPEKQAAITSLPYATATKAGLQYKRRFWEEDEDIFGGITFTNLPNNQISYPSADYLSNGKGVLLGAFNLGVNSFHLAAMTPQQRVEACKGYVNQIHPQSGAEFDNGVAVTWHRVPFTQGCFGMWTETTRKQHYKNAIEMDKRVALAGEHCSYIPAWQEGSILSVHNAMRQIHARAQQASK